MIVDPQMLQKVNASRPAPQRASEITTNTMVSKLPTLAMTGPHTPSKIYQAHTLAVWSFAWSIDEELTIKPELNTTPLRAIPAIPNATRVLGGSLKGSMLR